VGSATTWHPTLRGIGRQRRPTWPPHWPGARRHRAAGTRQPRRRPAPAGGLAQHPGPSRAGLGLLAATFCGLLPYGIVIAGVRRRRWTDRHLRTRQQRPVPLLAGIGSVVAGLAALLALDAPRQLVALVVAMLTGLAATLVVTLWWKLSVHAAAASGTVAILALTFGPALTLTVPTVALVAWARVRLGDHTPAQTVAGAALGGLVATTVFIALR
jgi:membrane-associated phospholipid phosphatase